MKVKLRHEALQEHILRTNLSQNSFARQVNLSSGYMTQLLAGTRRPSGRVRERIMRASGLDFDTLFQVVPQGEEKQEETRV